MDKKLVIQISPREQNTPAARYLKTLADIEPQITSLPTADYVISNYIAIKHKDTADFIMSIQDRRIYRQVAALQADFERVILIIEGDLQLLYRVFSADIIRSAIAFLAATKGVTVLQTPSAEETAALIRSLARQARKGKGYERSFRSDKPRVNPGTVFLVEGLPGIGPRRARQLLDRFGTPAAIMRASPDELIKVAGIGPKRAKQIWEALNASYQA